jgi:hypothetical protein
MHQIVKNTLEALYTHFLRISDHSGTKDPLRINILIYSADTFASPHSAQDRDELFSAGD